MLVPAESIQHVCQTSGAHICRISSSGVIDRQQCNPKLNFTSMHVTSVVSFVPILPDGPISESRQISHVPGTIPTTTIDPRRGSARFPEAERRFFDCDDCIGWHTAIQ